MFACRSLIDTVGMVTVEIGLETGMTVQKEDLDLVIIVFIAQTCPYYLLQNFTYVKKNGNFSVKKCYICLIFALKH